ncbi:DUF3237 domain-containing protein [Paenibacillus bovis]|uniref:UPF0311 protein AR543_08955 n=1 Tax=Paenibacillus bovis TaxID=1616788 RepID=A0A172ZEP8_9BACL|nr:DUF3237 domain-containing protein [Paenibacillus bovis]ANF96115.1 hypothetical protein AR543_08955 [Paenibacillus bovis]
MQQPTLNKIASLTIQVDTPIDVGVTPMGRRRLIPILSGKVTGQIEGNLLPGGVDSQIIRPDSKTDLSARYVIRTHDNELIYIENNGIRQVSEPYREQAAAGEIIAPEHVYFRTVPVFETSSPRYSWLQDRICIGAATRLPDAVLLDIYEVL